MQLKVMADSHYCGSQYIKAICEVRDPIPLRKRDQEFTGLESTELVWNSFFGELGDSMSLRLKSSHRLSGQV